MSMGVSAKNCDTIKLIKLYIENKQIVKNKIHIIKLITKPNFFPNSIIILSLIDISLL